MSDKVADFGELLHKYQDQLVGGLAGAAIGGGGTALAMSQHPDESDEDFGRRRLQGATLGALSGGAAGAFGTPLVEQGYKALTAPKEGPSLFQRIVSKVNPVTNAATGIPLATGAAYGTGRLVDLDRANSGKLDKGFIGSLTSKINQAESAVPSSVSGVANDANDAESELYKAYRGGMNSAAKKVEEAAPLIRTSANNFLKLDEAKNILAGLKGVDNPRMTSAILGDTGKTLGQVRRILGDAGPWGRRAAMGVGVASALGAGGLSIYNYLNSK